jgi:hypothetical protein
VCRRDHLQLGIGLVARHTGLETADDEKRFSTTIGNRETGVGVEVTLDCIVDAGRDEVFGTHHRRRTGEVRGRDTDDPVVLAVDAHTLLQDLGIESGSLP